MRGIVETIDKYGLRQSQLNKHVKDTDGFYREFVERNYKSEIASKYSKRFKKHWQQLWTFLHNDNVPWNNNNAEAAVKAFAQHRHGVKGQMHVREGIDYPLNCTEFQYVMWNLFLTHEIRTTFLNTD